ncbi:hypothetical protein LCGC14_2514600 [marine sediment metagenome]|uniref:Helix-turn-helix domain-containing protein n=1 Tax=marine sediment metagenome TaxID=412755 RepID=A0A0F9BL48_9ZZZZ
MKSRKEAMTQKEVAAYFGVSYQTILEWRKNRNLPWFETINVKEFGTRRRVFFYKDAVVKWGNENHLKKSKQRLRIRGRRQKMRRRAKRRALKDARG